MALLQYVPTCDSNQVDPRDSQSQVKFLRINSHRFLLIKFLWATVNNSINPFVNLQSVCFVLQHWRLCSCFVLGCWNYAVPFVLCPMQCRQKRAEAIGELRGTVCLRCLKTVLVVCYDVQYGSSQVLALTWFMNYEALFLNAYELRYLPVRTSYGKAPFVFVFFCFIWNIRKARWDSVGRKGAVMVCGSCSVRLCSVPLSLQKLQRPRWVTLQHDWHPSV